MRYYSITISDPKTGQVWTPPGFPPGALGGASYTSFVNGKTLPGAWDVLLDIPVIDAATSQGFSLARVYGVSVQEIAQASDLNGKNIAIAGGMQAGLPLANPAQAGPLVSGVVNQAFGNWEGNVQTLDLVISPGTAMPDQNNAGGSGSAAKPKNLTLNWQGGQPLGPALKSCLQVGFPGYTVNVNISDQIVRPAGDNIAGANATLGNLAESCRAMSRSIVKTPGYAGVSVVMTGKTINVFDGTAQGQGADVQIAFTDLIGQPTWIQSPNISAKVVMRSTGLKIGAGFTLPQTVVVNSADANSNLINQRATFQGGFTMVGIRHVGAFRNPSGDAWVTVIEGAPKKVVGMNG